MPLKADICGIYKIVNRATNQCYVGQSQYIRKRLGEHFRLLRLDKHPNPHLQNAYNKYGKDCFYGAVEVMCESPKDLDMLEELFLAGQAYFPEPVVYNIANFAAAPMRGRTHTEETRAKIRLGRRAATFDYQSPEYRATLQAAHMARFRADPKFVAKVQFIRDNPNMSYAALARALGSDTSSVRRLALKYRNHKEF